MNYAGKVGASSANPGHFDLGLETFNLVNYAGVGLFTAQNDGQGGALVFDPPDANSLTVQPAINSNNPELKSLAIDDNVPAMT